VPESTYGISELQIEGMILDYLRECPNGEDSLEGIALFWIPRSAIQVEMSRLRTVLRRLTNVGFLEEIGSGERVRYRVRRDRDLRSA
jgi:hypothetical protein